MPVFNIIHITKYKYNQAVKESCNEIKIYPFAHSQQEVLNHQIDISHPAEIYAYTDYWGNKAGFFNVLKPHTELVIESKLTIRTTSTENIQLNSNIRLEDLNKVCENNFKLLELIAVDKIVNQSIIDAIIDSICIQGKSVIEIVEAASAYVFNHFKYIKGITTVETTVDEILDQKAGVCQDFAHLLLQILRTIKIPSRYVSGYICPNKNGMRGEGATHAWVETFIPEYGWVGIDPTNNIWVTNTHVVLAVGKNFSNCTPVKGAFKGTANQKLSVFVSIGYEDGQSFEDITNVFQNENSTENEVSNTIIIASQQQQ